MTVSNYDGDTQIARINGAESLPYKIFQNFKIIHTQRTTINFCTCSHKNSGL